MLQDCLIAVINYSLSIKPMARRRHLSRIAVMQTLFESERRPDISAQDALTRNMKELNGADETFAWSILEGILAVQDELFAEIQEHAPDWSLERMDPISRCILRVGAYELLFANDAPPAVVMDEAIEIAKEYGSAESGKFVNGVLNAIAHREDT